MAFCGWARQVTGRAVRLPSEAQWEKAARGTDGRITPGNEPPDAARCNFSGRVGDSTPVGRAHSPQGDSPYGCADMAGNVWEWVGKLVPGGLLRDFTGSEPDRPSEWGTRGWCAAAAGAVRGGVRAAFRAGIGPASRRRRPRLSGLRVAHLALGSGTLASGPCGPRGRGRGGLWWYALVGGSRTGQKIRASYLARFREANEKIAYHQARIKELRGKSLAWHGRYSRAGR